MSRRLPYGTNVPGIRFTENYIMPAVNGERDTITCILGTANSGPVDPTIIKSASDFKLLFDVALQDDYGIKAANVILPDTVMFVRVLSKGARTVFKDDDKDIFTAKEGGTHLVGSTINISIEKEAIKIDLVRSENLLESIVCSSNPLDGEYIFKVFNNYSTYLKLATSDDYQFEAKSLVGSGGTTGAARGVGQTEGFEVATKYPDARLNNTVVHLLNTLEGKPYIQLIRNSQVIEEIPFSNNLENLSDFIARANAISNYIEITKLDSFEPCNVTITGGNAGTTSVTSEDFIEALDKIADASIYRVDTLIIPGVTDNRVQAYAQEICEFRGDTLFIADHPLGLRSNHVRDFVRARGQFTTNTPLASSYVSVFSPWVKYNDGNVSYYPSSIFAAKQLSNNDKSWKVWDSCAGVKRGVLKSIAGLEYDPSKSEMDILYNDALVNPIVNITGKGFIIWGNKTTRPPMYKNAPEPVCSLNVRRLINYLRKVIYDATLPLLFEANDAFTWAMMENIVNPILTTIKNGRGIDDYKFICNETTNTAENIDSLIMSAVLMIRPTRSAEYINIDLNIYPYTVEFPEIGGDN